MYPLEAATVNVALELDKATSDRLESSDGSGMLSSTGERRGIVNEAIIVYYFTKHFNS